jgi:hypothetical protein
MTSSRFDFSTTDASSSGVYLVTHDDIASIDAAASDAGWLVRGIELTGCADQAVLLQRIATALDIPDSWKSNWDALAYCLRDLSWIPAPGYVVLFDHADAMRDSAKADFTHLLDVFDEAGFTWAERGIPFWAFFAISESAFDEVPE